MKMADALLDIDLSGWEQRVLNVGTSMIPEHTAEALGNDHLKCHESPLWDVISYTPWGEYGWIIYPREHLLGDTSLDEHPELRALLDFAHQRGYSYVQLDCDGEPLPSQCGLPTFSW